MGILQIFSRRSQWRGYTVIAGGILIHLTLGTIYTFGNMTSYITSYFRAKNIEPDLTYADSTWILSLAAMGQGGAMFFGGLLVKKLGPRLTALLGSWISSIGVLLTYFTVQHSFVLTVITYGAVFGIGVGIAYAIPMACAMKWLPERKGLVNGLVVAGFGGGAFIFDQVQTAFLNPDNKEADVVSGSDKYFDQADILDKVPQSFLLLGGCYASMQLIGSLLLVNPPDQSDDEERKPLIEKDKKEEYTANDEKLFSPISQNTTDNMEHLGATSEYLLNASTEENPSQNELQNKDTKEQTEKWSLSPTQVLKTKSFYILWFLYLFNGQGIQFVSTLYKAYGQTFIKDDHFLAIVGSLSAVCNGGGRIMWGIIADKFSVRSALMFSCGIFCISVLTFEVTSLVGKSLYTIYVCILFLSFSGNFVLLPTATARTFGQTYYELNYGMVFTASIITSPVSAILTSNLKSSLGWDNMFFLIAGFSFISVCLSWFFKVEKRSENL